MLKKFQALLHRRRFESEMEAELQAHREAHIDDLIARGATREQAATQAAREFGPVLQLKDECRDARGLYWPDALSRDLRYAVRQLRQHPTFTLTAIATLALCIGANTAIYSVADAVLFRPLPYPEPARLAAVAALRRTRIGEYDGIAQRGSTWLSLHQNARSFDVAVHSGDVNGINFVSPTGPRYVKQERVSAGFFRVLGVAPLFGREFADSEDHPGGPALAVLGNQLWRTAFHSDPAAIGQKITLRGEPFTIVGVMPPNFQTSAPADLWTPLRATATGEGGGENFEIIARLRLASSWTQAAAEIATLSPAIVAEWRLQLNQSAVLHLVPLQAGLSQELRKPILILWSAVALVLLIGCVNIAGLLLARSATRSKEIATRLALGSGRGAIVRQFLAESCLLGIGGGILGCALGLLGIYGLRIFAQDTLGIWQTLALDPRVLAATAALSIAASFIFGLYPALSASRLDLRAGLNQSGRTASASHRGWPRRILIVAEVALGVVLLVGAGLLIRTFSTLMNLPPGFDGKGVLTATLSLQDARYADAPAVNRLFDDSLARLRQTPGVQSAAVCLTLPYQRALQEGFTRVEGPNSGAWENTTVTYTTPQYLDAFRIPLLRGRAFTPADRAESRPVAIVNESFARKYLGGMDALGLHVNLERKAREIVGIAGDVQVRSGGWGNIGPVGALPGMLLPAAQMSGKFFEVVHVWFSPSWVVRSTLPLSELTAPLQTAVSSIDPQLPFSHFRTMNQLRSQSVALQRLETILLGSLAALALLLSALGIYGLIANTVVERTREFGIRLALGSPLSRAVRDIAISGLTLSLIGLAIGCALARAVSTALKSLIWGVTPGDPAAFLAAATALLLVAVLACFIPSLRVSRIDPAQTLRE